MKIFTDSRCLDHAPVACPEIPRRLAGILAELERRGADLHRDEPHAEAGRAVRAVHDEAYVDRFERAVARGDGILDSADNPLCPATWSAAWAAVEATLHGADEVAAGGGRAFAAVRPPGHHAERGLAMGFCFFNNAAVAAQYLRDHHGVGRVAIYDFDVHHGNGTQHIFEARADVFYASSHQFPFYPGTGAASEKGRAKGQGATLNVPLPAGTGPEAFLEVVDEVILPSLLRFRPEVLIASAGFDAWKGDPLGGLRLEEETFRQLGERLRSAADEVAGGRLLSVLEGGYDLEALPRLVATYLEGVGS
jgi:acetoin utilization deacetylase AcuC-like enzyme